MVQLMSQKRALQVLLSIPHYFHEFVAEVRSPADAYVWAYFKLPYLFRLCDFPTRVTIEPTNECNFSCRHCARSVMSRNVGFMDLGVFEKIVAELGRRPSCVMKIGGLGEPALHPQFRLFMNLLKQHGVRSTLYTNGTLLREYDHEEILNWGVRVLVVSIDGVDAESFERIRVGGDYDLIKKAVGAFYQLKKRLKYRKPELEIRHVIMPNEPRNELVSFRVTWLEIADTVKFNYLFPLTPAPVIEERPMCRDIMREFYIRWDGRVPLCGYQSAWLGDLHTASIRELWHDAKLQELRQVHRKRDLSAAPVCRSCSFR
jgi:MoaA/NifB/PqqE/SkfB family radical SAM enzyme